MGRADELRAELEEQRAAFRAAVEAAAERWEQSPGGEEWAPRQVAEHAIGAEARFASRAAAAIQSREVEAKSREFASAADALAALDEVAASADRVYRYIEDRDLEKAAEQNVQRFPATIEGVMQLAAYHLGDHAEQLRAGA